MGNWSDEEFEKIEAEQQKEASLKAVCNKLINELKALNWSGVIDAQNIRDYFIITTLNLIKNNNIERATKAIDLFAKAELICHNEKDYIHSGIFYALKQLLEFQYGFDNADLNSIQDTMARIKKDLKGIVK